MSNNKGVVIGSAIGAILGGPVGAMLGFAVGAFIDESKPSSDSKSTSKPVDDDYRGDSHEADSWARDMGYRDYDDYDDCHDPD